ncbi:MAG: hypothetical protein F4W90_11805 [Gammaproteobacteria bacterium]|nr:hypothetical protein [Gammaproteobacteria bacterium]
MKLALTFALAAVATAALATAESDEKRTPWGTPDFTGTYDTATLTPVQRPNYYGTNLYISKEEAEKRAKDQAAGIAAGSSNKDPKREAPPQGGDGSPGAAGNVGGYNTFWIDMGDTVNAVDGKFRTSIITYPENGRRPGLTPEAQQRIRAFYGSFARNDGTASWLNRGDGSGPYDNPERLTLADRCLQGFSSTGGPPMMPALYNNHKRIVHGPDTVVILVEMVHDARVIRIGGEHPPDDVRYWMGDSIGWWEDDTLVVETTNFNDTPAQMPATRNLKVTERFERQDADNLHYSFTVEDPATWQDKWSGDYVWPESDENIYEYACHEGNYAMGNILRGARRLEREALAASE